MIWLNSIVVASSGSLHKDVGSNPGGAKVMGIYGNVNIYHSKFILCLSMRAFVVFGL